MANSTNLESEWFSLMDYAAKFDVSLSTLRRHIKAGKVQYKIENGRYLLRAPFAGAPPVIHSAHRDKMSASAMSASASPSARTQASELEIQLRRAQEEIAELKMLVAIYEEQLSPERPAPLGMNGH